MSDLDAEFCAAHAPGLRDHARERGFVVVGIQAQTAVGDAAMPFDLGCLHDHQAAPECAIIPRCIRCQSLAQPSSAEYWHMGDTTMRLASSRPARRKGENKRTGHVE